MLDGQAGVRAIKRAGDQIEAEERPARRKASGLLALAIALPALMLSGWMIGIPALRAPGHATVPVGTALCLLVLSMVLLVRQERIARKYDALQRRDNQLRSILAGVPDAVIVTDREGWVLDFSEAAARLWAVPLDASGCNMSTYLGDKVAARLAELLARREPAFLLTGDGVRTNGSQFPLELRGALLADSDGDPRFTLFARDLSQKLAADQHFVRLGVELAQVSRHNAMGELAADLAHELNQPLTAAINYLSAVGYMLSRQEGTGNTPEMVAQARAQVARAGEIIRRMREFAQHSEVEKRAESLVPMLDDAVRLVTAGSGAHDIEIELAVEPREIQVFIDRVQVQQVVVNLLRNAVEAIRSTESVHGKIVITAHPIDAEWVELEFRDNGPGVPDAILDQLFERFTSTKADAGMGIGLSISRRIVEAHGGAMRVINGKKGGATFLFTLPAMAPATIEA